jgi:hypothetical protein
MSDMRQSRTQALSLEQFADMRAIEAGQELV